ncbi:MAG: aldo/keto reductase [Desulfobacterales bacterium]|nr:MAG: aldo/keto reductase [Desulfobacterales bacterium]
MNTVRLGKTELVVSQVGFGGIPIIPLGFEDGVAVVRHCFQRGITFFDTANMYGDSEKKIGQALETVRDKVVIATKTLERSAEGTAKHIAYSLENLKSDYIDLYQMHNISKENDLNEILASGGALEAVNKAKADGKIKFIGFSSHDIAMAIKVCRTGLFSAIQFPFNFIESDPADELFKVAQELDMGIIAMKPLGGGLLERADLCFRFLQQYPYVVPIPGIQNVEEANEIFELYRSPQPLSQKDLSEIEKIRSELGKRFCHRCGYCVPCEQGVKIPEVLGFRTIARRLSPAITIAFTKDAMETVGNCTDCGECLDKCPYRLAIPDLIQEYQTLFQDYVSKHG